MDAIWNGIDQAALDRGDARASGGDYEAEIAAYRIRSAAPRATLPMHVDLVFDPASACALDWFPAAPGRPAQLVVGGSSAGGHPCGMLPADGWPAGYGLVAGAIRGAVTLSGLFDLEPIRLGRVNGWMDLDAAAQRNGPSRHVAKHPPAPRPLASHGGWETSASMRQREGCAAAWAAAGHDAQVVAQAGRNHFDVVWALGDPGEPLCQAAAAWLLQAV